MLKTGNDVNEILLCLSIGFYAGRGHRPQWMSWGVVVSAMSAYLLAFPHIIYGPGREALALTEKQLNISILKTCVPVVHFM
ncbi:hypothetical protein PR048_012284 [Dryococelus australis]|uniref:Uncharacterized protein n=1 Tax=Dryococelus australis TaxID=614101 RepID=A0ABQ9HNY1_9NEOP|nr:hypothetical protein PR048_012284 [Dryococelus australis]